MTTPAVHSDRESRTQVNPLAAHPHALLATSSLTDAQTRVLKHGDTFAVFDRYGDAMPGGLNEHGLYHESTRFLSCSILELDGNRPFFLSSTVHDENDRFDAHLTNPDLLEGDRVRAPLGMIHLAVEKFLWQAACYQQIRVSNYGRDLVRFRLRLRFGADFADIFEVRGQHRRARGRDLAPELSEDRVILAYHGLDDVVRRTVLHFTPAPTALAEDAACWELALGPGADLSLAVEIGCERQPRTASLLPLPVAREEAAAEYGRSQAWSCRLASVNGQFNAWFNRAVSDLHMMVTALPTGPYPYAGLPWFNTPFGRDGLVTALECLWMRPDLAKGVLSYLASTQATAVEPDKDAEPGKILHETRIGEMAALKEMPYGQYYGSVDATPLFVVLAGAYFERTGDVDSIGWLWPHIAAALDWIDRFGDLDGDGLVEYQRKTPLGLLHQGWKDSDDAICHASGTPADGPIAALVKFKHTCLPRCWPAPGWRSLWNAHTKRRRWQPRRRPCDRGSKNCSGSRSWAPMRWRWTERSNRAGCAPRTRANACLQESPARRARDESPRRSSTRNSSRAGECAPWHRGKRDTIRFRTTTDPSGLMTTR